MGTNEGRAAGAQQVPPTPTTGTERNTGNDTHRRRVYQHTRKTGSSSTTFKGETEKMNGNVFQLHSERARMSQFTETLEAFRVYSSYTQ